MRLTIAILAIALLCLTANAQVFTQIIGDAGMQAITGRADSDTEELAVGPTGNIYVIDEDEFGNDRVVRLDSAGANGIIITTEDDVVAAIELVNGTATVTDFSINGIELDSDGDVILSNGDGSGPEALVSVADAAAGAITVISTAVDAATSPLEGCTGMTVIGTTAYIGLNGGFGAAEDQVVTIGTNAAGPAAAATVIITEAELIAANGAAAGAFVLNAFSAGGSGLLFADSGSSGTSDDVFTSDVAGTTVSVLAAATAIEAALGATDIGINDTAQDASGALWLTNPFGGGTGDNGLIKIVDPSGTPVTHLFPQSQVDSDLNPAATGSSPEGLGVDGTNSRIVIANGSGDNDVTGVISVSDTSVPVELSIFSTN